MSLFETTFDRTPYRRTGEHLKEIAFPLGGIGTGCVSLDGRGGLRDWEIFNRPNKGSQLDYTFPALWWQTEGEEPKVATIQGPRQNRQPYIYVSRLIGSMDEVIARAAARRARMSAEILDRKPLHLPPMFR